jgi:hypothetical protein
MRESECHKFDSSLKCYCQNLKTPTENIYILGFQTENFNQHKTHSNYSEIAPI